MNNISISGEQLFQLDIEFKEVAEEHGYYHYCTDKLGNIDSVNYELTVINPINFLELNGESIMKPMLDHNYKVVSVKRKKRMLRRDLIIIVVEYL